MPAAERCFGRAPLEAAKGVAAYAGGKRIVTLWSMVLWVEVSAWVGLVCIHPAMRAAHLHPSKRFGTSRPVTPRSSGLPSPRGPQRPDPS